VNVTTTSGRITQLSQSSGGLSRTVQLQYSSGGHLSAVIDGDGAYTQFYSPYGTDTGQVVQITDPYNAATNLTFDSSSRVTAVDQTNPPIDGGTGDAITRLSYTSSTQTLVADPTTNQSQSVSTVPHTTYTIDSSSHLVTNATDPQGNSRSAGYTPFGDVNSSTNAAGGNTAFSYPSGTNGGESLTSIANPGGATESAMYGSSTAPYLPSSTKDDAGSALSYTYDTNGNQLSTAQGASGPQAKVDYNSDGTPKDSMSPGATAMTTYTYGNSDGDLTSVTPPSNSSLAARTYTYDGFGRLSTATTGVSTTTLTYTYDSDDRITKVHYSDSTQDVSYTYDKNGHVTQRVDGSGTTTYTYDDLGHLLTVKNTANNNLITYTYDLAGALASVTNGLGTTSYKYDSAHELTEMDYPQGGSTLSTYFKNVNGKRTDVWLQAGGSNTAPTSWAAHEQYTYDSSGRITKVLAQNGPATGPTTVENETLCYTSGSTPGSSCPAATGSGVERHSV
jgi:YD repeat-containing protein